MITNYDPDVLSNAERSRLHEQAEQAPFNDVLIDIRAGFPGGDFPCRGASDCEAFMRS